jgi:hypothetical protein
MHLIDTALKRRIALAFLLSTVLTFVLSSVPFSLFAAGSPIVRITIPSDGAVLATPEEGRFEVQAYDPASGTSNGAGIRVVEFEIAGTGFIHRERYPAYCAFGGDTTCNPMPTELFTQLQGQRVVLRARAIARSGATSGWVSHTFQVGRRIAPEPMPIAPDIPVVTVVRPAEDARITDIGETTFTAEALVPGVASRNGAGIRKVVFRLEGANLTTTEHQPGYCMFGGDATCKQMDAAQFAALPDGEYTLLVQATAENGNVSDWVRRSFTIDRDPDVQPTTMPPVPSSVPTTVPTTPPALPPGSVQATLTATQWQLLEIPLQAERDYSERAAYNDIVVTARFRQGEREMVVRGFWDDGRAWVVRWTPPTSGIWQVAIDNANGDAGLQREAAIEVRAANERGFVRVDPVHEAFVFDNGDYPTLIGTTTYEVVKQVRAGDTNWQTAFAQYHNHGIGKVRVLACPWPVTQWPTGYPDSSPFPNGNHSLTDPAHWQALDQVLEHARQTGLVVDLAFFADNERCFGSTAEDERYVRYVLARYAAYPNLIWNLTNEWEFTKHDRAYWNRTGELVRAEDPWMEEAGRLRALSIHQKSRLDFVYADAGWPTHSIVQVNQRQGYAFGDEWGSVSIQTNSGQGRPVVNDELGYYDQTHKGIHVDRAQIRRSLWAIMTVGGYGTAGDASLVAGGLIYKSGRWHDLGGVYDDMRILHETLQSIPRWWEYREQPAIIRSGQRIYAGGAPDLGYLVYAANGGSVRLVLPDGHYRLTRLDPRSGARVDLGISDETIAWNPSAGADWVLLIDQTR